VHNDARVNRTMLPKVQLQMMVAMVSSEDSDLEATQLWHMRLEHTSERGMDGLSKQVRLVREWERWTSMNIACSTSNVGFLLV